MSEPTGKIRRLVRAIFASVYRFLKKERKKRINHVSRADLSEWEKAEKQFKTNYPIRNGSHGRVEGRGVSNSHHPPSSTSDE